MEAGPRCCRYSLPEITHHRQSRPRRDDDLQVPSRIIELLADRVLQQRTRAEPSHHVDVAQVLEVWHGQLCCYLHAYKWAPCTNDNRNETNGTSPKQNGKSRQRNGAKKTKRNISKTNRTTMATERNNETTRNITTTVPNITKTKRNNQTQQRNDRILRNT